MTLSILVAHDQQRVIGIGQSITMAFTQRFKAC
jgi:hypothetical protein